MLEVLQHVEHPDRRKAGVREVQILKGSTERGDAKPRRGLGSGPQRLHRHHLDARLRQASDHGPGTGTDVPEGCDSLLPQQVKNCLEPMVEPVSVAAVKAENIQSTLRI